VSEPIDKARLLEQIGMKDNWAIFEELAQKNEDELRRILRPHDDTGLGLDPDSTYIPLRRRLDNAFDALTLLEIGRETGVYSDADIEAGKTESFRKLTGREGSDAVLRYANAYLYFGARILAGRYYPMDWKAITPPYQRTDDKTNRRFFPLEVPPDPASAALSDPFADRTAKFATFLSQQYHCLEPTRQDDWRAALDFLDGLPSSTGDIAHAPYPAENFESSTGESVQYELWLRGLITATDPTAPAVAALSSEGAAYVLPSEAAPPATPRDEYFEKITRGLVDWLESRTQFYLPHLPDSNSASKHTRPAGSLIVTNPVAARFALADIYWIARLLRADVSGNATVTYSRTSWVQLLRFHATLTGDDALAERLRDQQEIIRSVFDFVCDLVQNAVAVSEESERRVWTAYEFPPETVPLGENLPWREVFDDELREISKQRSRRTYADVPPSPPDDSAMRPSRDIHWSERLITGIQPHDRVGLAFSGGGIRSASFNLGVLQGLQGFDLLRQVDYLSTVSGGGFIGAWLVANVQRTRHWLGKATCWDESIAHLRAYSSYLAPITGILSADTWTLAASWIRNTFLIQLSGLVWLFALLLSVFASRMVFLFLTDLAIPHFTLVGLPVVVTSSFVTVTLIYNFIALRDETRLRAPAPKWVRRLTVLPAWIGSFILASMLWANAQGKMWAGCACQNLHSYSSILENAWRSIYLIVAADWIAMVFVGWFALKPVLPHAYAPAEMAAGEKVNEAADAYIKAGEGRPVTLWFKLTWSRIRLMSVSAHPIRHRLWRSLWIGTLCAFVLYLALCAILYLYLYFVGLGKLPKFDSYAFVLGPALVLFAFTLSVVFFIGLSGRVSNEPQREWWTRYGAWLTIYATVGLVFSAAAIFGPMLTLLLFRHNIHHASIKWGTVLSGLGTVIGGLFAGNSSKTAGDGSSGKKSALELLARLGGLIFIIGFVIVAASILYFFLLFFATNDSLNVHYGQTLNDFDTFKFLLTFAVIVGIGILFSRYFEINIFGLSQFYRNRLVRCYLGATRWAPGVRRPQPFTKFDFRDDMPLSDLKNEFRGPFPIFNCTLNLGGSSDLTVRTRHSASFSLTPLRCGSDRLKVGYVPTGNPGPGFAGGVMLGQAVAVSGAAVSPNMGYNTSPLVALLLTMFNLRLGWWFPNPGQPEWKKGLLKSSLRYLTEELLGLADENRRYLNVTDGGHFENLGVYELVRRRCKVIIACDAECDELLQFGGLGNLVRICATDFDAIIDIDVKAIQEQREGHSLEHCTVGKIKYSNGSIGYLIYLKASITGDEDIGTAQYRSAHPSFPHESTANQFFTEDQFESYRKLGLHIVRHSLRGSQSGDSPLAVAEKLADVMAPTGATGEAFLRHTRTMQRMWEEFRCSPSLHSFINELMSRRPPPRAAASLQTEELCMALQLIQLMEDVFMDLRLDDFWEHPDNRGWAILFMRWARSPRFQKAWTQTHRTFGIRFEYFCEARLGLTRDNPIVRV
jgi:hypothetical protein